MRQKQVVQAAAAACADVVADGWSQAVSDRATEYVSDATFKKLLRRKRRRCRGLADLAKAILDGKTKLHDLVGSLGERIMALFGGGPIERQFARELAGRIPLPPDTKLTATARGIQVTGILLCVMNGDDLTRCQCFVDLALELAKSRVKQILASALEDWARLPLFAVNG